MKVFMRPTMKFNEGNRMSSHETVLFEKCPLCGQAKITIEKPRRLLFSKPKINACPRCSAEFAAKGSDNYQLVFCEPRSLVGRHNCRDRIFRGCYLDAVFSKAEWQQISEGGESSAFARFLEMSEKFCLGLLPTYPSEGLPFTLESGEVVHYVSSPVYLDEKKPSQGKASDEGTFFLTNKRIGFVYPSGTLTIRLGNIMQVEDTSPGFLVKAKGSHEPWYFFPPANDPALAAVRGAIRNLKRKG